MLVDAGHRKPVDRQTSLTVTGSYVVVSHITPAQRPDNELIHDYLGVLGHTAPRPAVTTKAIHHMKTIGPPTFSRPRRLTLENFRLDKEEFDSMLEIGINRSSSSL